MTSDMSAMVNWLCVRHRRETMLLPIPPSSVCRAVVTKRKRGMGKHGVNTYRLDKNNILFHFALVRTFFGDGFKCKK